jgi:hypothetical protein
MLDTEEFYAQRVRSRPERINAFLDIAKGGRYLEIGVHKGKTFHKIQASHKVGVDPKFMFDTAEYSSDSTEFWEITSDEFFARVAPRYDKFDVIYLDGLHTFEQVFRDLITSLSYCHDDTIILIDDTVPVNVASFQKTPNDCSLLREELGINDKAWMGDVCKVVIAIKEFMPAWSYATFPNHGQTALVKRARQDFSASINSLEAISRLSYTEYLTLKKEGAFNIFETDDQVIARIRDLLADGQE